MTSPELSSVDHLPRNRELISFSFSPYQGSFYSLLLSLFVTFVVNVVLYYILDYFIF